MYYNYGWLSGHSYHKCGKMSMWRIILVANFPCGENPEYSPHMWQNVLVAKIPCGEISLWRIIVANNPVAKLSVANHPFTVDIRFEIMEIFAGSDLITNLS